MEISGTLRRNDLDKWEIVDDDGRACELSSGYICEVQIGGRWIRMRVEFCHGSRPAGGSLANVAGGLPACGSPARDDGHYYAVQLGILPCEGWPARVMDGRDSFF
jgi:hypothetical protein